MVVCTVRHRAALSVFWCQSLVAVLGLFKLFVAVVSPSGPPLKTLSGWPRCVLVCAVLRLLEESQPLARQPSPTLQLLHPHVLLRPVDLNPELGSTTCTCKGLAESIGCC